MGQKTYKSANLLFAQTARFLILESATKLLILFMALTVGIGVTIKHHQNAFDYIEVVATNNHQNPVFSIFDQKISSFDLTIQLDESNVEYKNQTTPFKLKVLKGEKIHMEVKAIQGTLDCSLKNGSYGVLGKHIVISKNKDVVVMKRNGDSFQLS